MNHAAILKPVMDAHSIPAGLRPDVVRHFTVIGPMTPKLYRFARRRMWRGFVLECRIALGEELHNRLFGKACNAA